MVFRHPPEVRAIVDAYLAGQRQVVGEPGSGTDGWVFSLEPHSVVKVHNSDHRFDNELTAYKRLKLARVTQIAGCHVPQLHDYDEEKRIIEISFVRPPYIIDFGKSYFDTPQEFTAEAWDLWQKKIEVTFGNKSSWAFQVYNELRRKHGIYHADMSLDNVNLGAIERDAESDEMDF